MKQFPRIKISKQSISSRKLVFGVGVNDSDYMVKPKVNGKKLTCLYYERWHAMIGRCYSSKYQERQPSYKGCSVCDEWLLFSNFRSWMMSQDWQGLELDKDIKIKGNKIYSPDTCLFIPRSLNGLLCNSESKKGKYPQGVTLSKRVHFLARIRCEGKLTYLGSFKKPEEASQAYQKARANKIQQLITNNTYPVATRYLAQHISMETV